MEFMTRHLWDALIIAIMLIGIIFAALRLRADLTRPLDDDQPNTQGD